MKGKQLSIGQNKLTKSEFRQSVPIHPKAILKQKRLATVN